MIFTRKIDDGLASLVKKLDAVVAENQDKNMAALVNFIGEDAEALQEAAAEFGKQHEITHTALIVPKEHANGPERYGIPEETSLAVILYRGKKVTVLHTLAEGQLDEDRIAAVVADTDKILTEEEKPEKDDKPDKGKKKDSKKEDSQKKKKKKQE